MKALKRTAMWVITLWLCASCNEELPEINPFIGTWLSQESTFVQSEVTVYASYTLTFFEEMTYAVTAEYTSEVASETKEVTGTYSFDDERIWLDDGGKLFGHGGYCAFSFPQRDVLTLAWANDTLVFTRQVSE
ncbi:MAG: hypothetical protein J5814_11195 [Bacteroidaceae bacterium]|nr:hypothetical protein [Bacteroidaceae bacterium]